MSRFTFNLATSADDEALGELLSATPMDGTISISFARRPSYFDATAVDGRHVQVAVVRDRDPDRIVGMGYRATSMRYVDREPVAVGYLGGLRLRPEYRGRAGLLAHAYKFLRELHHDRVSAYYLTTIATDNVVQSVLTSSRAGLPIYHPFGTYHTLIISTSRYARNGASHRQPYEIRPARDSDRDSLFAFLNLHGPSRQYFPVYEQHDIFGAGGLLRGLRPDDILLTIQDGQIIGTLGCWDQRAYKQISINHYSPSLSILRPVYNAWATLRRHPVLPPVGATLPVNLAAIPVIRDDCPAVFHALLNATLHQLAAHGERLLLVGLHERDPLLPIAREFAGRTYLTNLYLVYWPEEKPDVDQLRQRVPYLELGSL
jgi:hypothetical protein